MQTATASFDVEHVRTDFPILSREVHGRPLVYLDNAATTQKPLAVLDRLARYYRDENANVHRGVHFLSAEGTENYEKARQSVQRFIGAELAREVVFTRGTTESINLVAHGFERGGFLGAGDEILISGAGAPRQHRPVADGRRADRGDAAGHPDAPTTATST